MTLKQEQFCLYYIQTKNGTQAIIKAGYNVDLTKKNWQITAAVMAFENLRKPNIQQQLERILTSAELNEKQVKLEHCKLILQDRDFAAKRAAIEMYYRLTGKFIDYKKTNWSIPKLSIPENLMDMTTAELLKLQANVMEKIR